MIKLINTVHSCVQDDSTLALLSEGEKPEPEDEEIRDLLNELQIQPLLENIATSVPKLENQEEKRDEVPYYVHMHVVCVCVCVCVCV